MAVLNNVFVIVNIVHDYDWPSCFPQSDRDARSTETLFSVVVHCDLSRAEQFTLRLGCSARLGRCIRQYGWVATAPTAWWMMICSISSRLSLPIQQRPVPRAYIQLSASQATYLLNHGSCLCSRLNETCNFGNVPRPTTHLGKTAFQ